MLPDRSVLIGQRLVENAKIQKFKCDILSNFQTLFVFFYDKSWQDKQAFAFRWRKGHFCKRFPFL